MDISRRHATTADKGFLYFLSKEAYRDTVIRQFGYWDEARHFADFEGKWSGSAYQILLFNDRSIGTIWVSTYYDHIALHEIQLLPEFQNKGIGRTLINEVIATASQCQKPIRLNVMRCNQAVNLYRRLGFATLKKGKTHFEMEYLPSSTQGGKGHEYHHSCP